MKMNDSISSPKQLLLIDRKLYQYHEGEQISFYYSELKMRIIRISAYILILFTSLNLKDRISSYVQKIYRSTYTAAN